MYCRDIRALDEILNYIERKNVILNLKRKHLVVWDMMYSLSNALSAMTNYIIFNYKNNN